MHFTRHLFTLFALRRVPAGFGLAALCLLFLLWQPGSRPTTGAETPPPNILFIAIDDLDTSIGAYGGQAQTPVIDGLAAAGVRFDAAYTDAVLCNPSRTSLVTGLRPTSTGIFDNTDAQKAWREFMETPGSVAYNNYGPGIGEITTLFQHFRANGYYVANSGKTFHNNQQQAEEQWDRNFSWPSWNSNGWPANAPLHGMDAYYDATISDWGAVEDGLRPAGMGQYFTEFDIPEYRIANNAITILNELPDDQPFLVSVGFVLPHNPRYVPRRLLDLYPPSDIVLPATLANDLDDVPPTPIQLISQGGAWYDQTYIFDDPDQWRGMLAAYYASATYVDEQIGRILTVLADRGLADDTIVVVWSDHGYHLGQKQHLQKNTLWRESARVPLIIYEPGQEAGYGVTAPVNSIDLFPTFAELAGLSMPDDFPRDGRSLVPLLRDPQAPWPWPGTTFLAHYGEGTVSRAALRTPEWAYLRYGLDIDGPDMEEELYDYGSDPLEWTNLLSPLNGDPAAYGAIRDELEIVLQGQRLPDQPPVAQPMTVTAPLFVPYPIALAGADGNNDPLVFRITRLPERGRLFQSNDGVTPGAVIDSADTLVQHDWIDPAYVLYLSDRYLHDSFEYSVTDGRRTASAQVTLVNPHPLGIQFMPVLRR